MKKYLGIEFGSTRIKGVLLDERHQIIATGIFNWENQLRNGIWTYDLSLAKEGLRECYKQLKMEFEGKTGEKLTRLDAIGISGMMHGYLVFDKRMRQIAEFRTWRNTNTEKASTILTEAFSFHVPQRWSVCHIYQAILNKEEGVKDIAFATTLAGYFHYLLSGEKVLGIGEASGVFPVDRTGYDKSRLDVFAKLIQNEVPWRIEDILPKVLLAGENAGYLTKEGAMLLDEEGHLENGIPLCPPEGDMGTGMVCTNCLLPGMGNVSIGTSSNLTLITGKPIGVYPEIDVIATPTGLEAALVHVNNGTSEINAWERLFFEAASHFCAKVDNGEMYSFLFQKALEGDKDSQGIYPVGYFSGEPVAKVNEGKPILLREPDAKMDMANFMKAQIYSLLATIRLGVDILCDNEDLTLRKVVGHGGFFKTPSVGETFLSAALGVPVVTLPSAGEGGPYGQALLAAYMVEKEGGESLEEYLSNRVFISYSGQEYMADFLKIKNFNRFLQGFRKALSLEKETISLFGESKNSSLQKLKEEVCKANLRLVKEGLVCLTWGNVSAFDKEKGLVVIKPSGVPYEGMKPDDMVVVDLQGRVIEGKYAPSTDTPTHLALYRHFKEVGSIVHTHSTFAVAFAQAGMAIPILGTTHADAFSGRIPCVRALSKEEIEGDYEANSGKTIVEAFGDLDPKAIPGALLPHHGPFAWGRSPKEAVDNAVILENAAKMAYLAKTLNPDAEEIGEDLVKKHYERKHGDNAYYGQGGNKNE